MSLLQAVDSLEVDVIVDNVTDGLSSTPSFVEHEWASLARRGYRIVAGPNLCCAAHGLSCLVTVRKGDATRRLLFDTGPDEDVFVRNVERLKLDLGTVDGIVLSHGHWDHGGALLKALDLIGAANGGRRVPCYMHPEMFATRAMRLPDGTMRPMADIPSPAALEARGAEVMLSRDPLAVLDGLFWISGEIPRVSPFETGLVGQFRKTPAGDWEADPLLLDERAVAVLLAGKGLFVFSACSHAGIVNVLTHAQASFPGTPVHGVLGGLHLSGGNERIIPQTVEALGAFGLSVVAAGHCTGFRAMASLLQAFGDQRLAPLAVGKRFTL
jgi:7,8-dihydropterin-6-yl-methyl-4-(beta-D-ribofuranosyl)aminobenzene 5'-phosphate synthase